MRDLPIAPTVHLQLKCLAHSQKYVRFKSVSMCVKLARW